MHGKLHLHYTYGVSARWLVPLFWVCPSAVCNALHAESTRITIVMIVLQPCVSLDNALQWIVGGCRIELDITVKYLLCRQWHYVWVDFS